MSQLQHCCLLLLLVCGPTSGSSPTPPPCYCSTAEKLWVEVEAPVTGWFSRQSCVLFRRYFNENTYFDLTVKMEGTVTDLTLHREHLEDEHLNYTHEEITVLCPEDVQECKCKKLIISGLSEYNGKYVMNDQSEGFDSDVRPTSRTYNDDQNNVDYVQPHRNIQDQLAPVYRGWNNLEATTQTRRDDKSYGRDSESHGRDNESHGRDNASHGRDNESHGRDNASHGRDNESHGRDNESHGRDNESHGRDNESHGRDNESHEDAIHDILGAGQLEPTHDMCVKAKEYVLKHRAHIWWFRPGMNNEESRREKNEHVSQSLMEPEMKLFAGEWQGNFPILMKSLPEKPLKSYKQKRWAVAEPKDYFSSLHEEALLKERPSNSFYRKRNVNKIVTGNTLHQELQQENGLQNFMGKKWKQGKLEAKREENRFSPPVLATVQDSGHESSCKFYHELLYDVRLQWSIETESWIIGKGAETLAVSYSTSRCPDSASGDWWWVTNQQQGNVDNNQNLNNYNGNNLNSEASVNRGLILNSLDEYQSNPQTEDAHVRARENDTQNKNLEREQQKPEDIALSEYEENLYDFSVKETEERGVDDRNEIQDQFLDITVNITCGE
ncbi:uncharacterized protein LOC108679371 isoform X2 [Hyalella azteca]|uniref:Uncharacterized protein LOC108679371 isoform X2 n=1 Tax=Hyalella azteca TaxID=294128 RepID=A0A8B7PBL6_HYAAZ|nr:uncharacterized protein LOC108679371 isoform X2 [Hyalella azteca]